MIENYLNPSPHDTIPRKITRYASTSFDLDPDQDCPDERHWQSQTRRDDLRISKLLRNDTLVVIPDRRETVSRVSNRLSSRVSTQISEKQVVIEKGWLSTKVKVLICLAILIALGGIAITLIFLIKIQPGDDTSTTPPLLTPPLTPAPFIKEYIVTDYITNLSTPTGIFHTPTGLIILQSAINQISKYTSTGLQRYAGSSRAGRDDSPSPTFTNLRYGALDSTGLLYVTDTNCLRRIDKSSQVITIAGNCSGGGYVDSLGPEARFDGLRGVAVQNDIIYLADSNNGVIRSVDAAARTTVKSFVKVVRDVEVVGVWRDVVYYTRRGDNAVYRERNSDSEVFLGDVDGGFKDGKGTEARFKDIVAIAFDKYGFMYIVDQGNNRVRKVDLEGNVVTLFVSGLMMPMDVVVDGDDSVYISDSGNGIIKKLVSKI